MKYFRVMIDRQGDWCVSLPHQCDSWDIAGEDGWKGVTRERAIEDLKGFLQDGQRALDALMNEEEY